MDQESTEGNNINIIKDDFLTSDIKYSYPTVLLTDQGYLGTLNPVVKQVESALKIKLVFVMVLGWTLLVEILFYMRSGNDTHPDTNNQLQPTELHDLYIQQDETANLTFKYRKLPLTCIYLILRKKRSTPSS